MYLSVGILASQISHLMALFPSFVIFIADLLMPMFGYNCTLPLLSTHSSHPTLCAGCGWSYHLCLATHSIITLFLYIPSFSSLPFYVTFPPVLCPLNTLKTCTVFWKLDQPSAIIPKFIDFFGLSFLLQMSPKTVIGFFTSVSDPEVKVLILTLEGPWFEMDESRIGHGVRFTPKAAVSPPTHLLKAILKLHESGTACHFPLSPGGGGCII